MKIEDKEIDKLLEDFQGEDIEVPDILEEKLNKKLIDIKPKNNKHKTVSKYLAASVIICVLSYGLIPSFRTFANNVFEYIFGDLGIENAVQNGYKEIESQTINIVGYDIEIDNIYMDSLRLSFETTIKNAKVEKNEFGANKYGYYIDVIGSENLGSITTEYIESDEEHEFINNIQIIGDGIKELYDNKKDRIELKLRLRKVENTENYKEDIVGEEKIVFNIPKEMYMSQFVNINKSVSDGNLYLDIKDLEISPTMMYLRSGGGIEGVGDSFGIYNFKIISDKGNMYKDTMILSARGDNNNMKQTIVPSIYYDKSKKFTLKADGVLIGYKTNIKISTKDTYPKKLDYLGKTIIINKFERSEEGLNLEVKVSDRGFSYFGEVSLDGDYHSIEGSSEENTHNFVFDIDEKDSYDLVIEPIIEYKIPIDIDFEVN